MANKPNPLLAALEAKLNAKHRQQLQINTELDRIAFLRAVHKELKVGPGRASFVLAEYMDQKMQVAQAIVDDIGDSHKKGGDGDPEFLVTKRNLAAEIKAIIGPEKWPELRELFPILREYW